MRIARMNGRRMLLVILMLSTFGCGTQGMPYRYRIERPTMTVAPIFHNCVVTDGTTGAKRDAPCVTLLREDYNGLIVEVKAACLATGGTDLECLGYTRTEKAE